VSIQQLLTRNTDVELPDSLKTMTTKDIKGVEARTGEKIWFRAVENFMNPEYSVLREYFPRTSILKDGVAYLGGAAQCNKTWIVGLLDTDCNFYPL